MYTVKVSQMSDEQLYHLHFYKELRTKEERRELYRYLKNNGINWGLARRARDWSKYHVELLIKNIGERKVKVSLNKVMLIGHLGSDPEMRFTANGQPVTNFRLAVNRRFADKDGAVIEETEWCSIVVWGKLAESCNQYLSKGRQVFIEGRLSSHSWEDDKKQIHYKTEVVASVVQFLGKPQKGDEEPTLSSEIDAGGTPAQAAQAVNKAVKSHLNRKVIKKAREIEEKS